MAFRDLKSARASDEKNGNTYIFGGVFAVYELSSDIPAVYSWDQVKSAAVMRRDITIVAGNRTFTVSNKMFDSEEELLRAIAIIECKQKEFGFGYAHEQRMIPMKLLYEERSMGKNVYKGEGLLDESDTAAAFIMLLNIKLVKLLWLIAILISLVVMGILHFTIGITRDNFLYFIPISLAAGGITVLLVYIITHAIARARFKSLADGDIASRQPITFIVSHQGFAACESSTYESRDLVPWEAVDYFVESDKMFILYKGKSPLAYIPKKAFDKKMVSGIADIIALHLEQR
ncbi:MAG: YcxB family protein [Ruminococcaceae bacterium]|nr:YcxB family protein [Oscillospiraceae bacterium]